MTYQDPSRRQPKGDHNRRLSLGLAPEQMAAEANVTTRELRDYEQTAPDHAFDLIVAERVGLALDRLEAVLPNSETGRQVPDPSAAIPSTTDSVPLEVLTDLELGFDDIEPVDHPGQPRTDPLQR